MDILTQDQPSVLSTYFTEEQPDKLSTKVQGSKSTDFNFQMAIYWKSIQNQSTAESINVSEIKIEAYLSNIESKDECFVSYANIFELLISWYEGAHWRPKCCTFSLCWIYPCIFYSLQSCTCVIKTS